MVIRSVDVKLESALTIFGWSTLSSQGQPNMSKDTMTISNDDRKCLFFMISSPFGSSELREVNPSISTHALTKSIHFHFDTRLVCVPVHVLHWTLSLCHPDSSHWAESKCDGRNVQGHVSAKMEALRISASIAPLSPISVKASFSSGWTHLHEWHIDTFPCWPDDPNYSSHSIGLTCTHYFVVRKLDW